MADLSSWRMGHRRGLDQLRGVAVLIVLVSHASIGSPIDKAGSVGVTIFFVLSGFLITRLLVEERVDAGTIDLRGFYARRARRLLPALVPGLALCAAANASTGDPVLRPAVAAITYTANFASTSEWPFAFGHLWSLAVEEHFYLAWPLLVAVLPLRAIPWLAAGGIVASTFARLTMAATDAEAYRWTQYRLDALLLGSLVAVVITRPPAVSALSTAAGAGLVVAFVPNAAFDVFVAWGMAAVAVGAAVLVLAALHVTTARPRLEQIGRISYGLYLFHFPLLHLTSTTLDLPPLVAGPAALAASFVVAGASWRFLEEPILRRRARPTPATVPASRV